MREGWQIKALGEVCEIIKGRKPILKAEKANGDLPYLVAKVMRGSAEAEYASVNDRNSITVQADETIIICDGSNSGEVFSGFHGILSSTMGKISKKVEIDDHYLRVFLSSTFEIFNGAKTGSAIPHLDKEAMYRLAFPLPPLPEQQRIVALLDEAFAGIAIAKANAERNLQNVRAIFESHLQSVFSQRGEEWEEKRLDTVSTILNGYAFKSSDFSANEGIKCIKITNVGVREFVSSYDEHLPDSFAKEYNKVSVKKGSIVLALTRTIIAGGLKVAVVPDEYDGALLNQRVASIIANEKELSSAFLFAYLSTQTVVDFVKERVITLMQPNLSITDLRSMPIPAPPRREQNRITHQLDLLRKETQRLTSLYESKLAALEELKKSLLHQAFNGEL
jgi:type I restriction enzyme, S subunit